MNFEVFFDKQPEKFLEKIDNKDCKRILDKIEELFSKEPVPSSSKRIMGEHGVYRIRIGDYRAIYRINYDTNKIIIIKIDKRDKVYE
ncbi:MAG: type II toxin-antitoxin system RelE/ParE family toxin [archaeon]